MKDFADLIRSQRPSDKDVKKDTVPEQVEVVEPFHKEDTVPEPVDSRVMNLDATVPAQAGATIRPDVVDLRVMGERILRSMTNDNGPQHMKIQAEYHAVRAQLAEFNITSEEIRAATAILNGK